MANRRANRGPKVSHGGQAAQNRSVTFVGDWLRCVPGPSGRVQVVQAGNVAWLSRLLAPALGVAIGDLKIVMPCSDAAVFAHEVGDPELVRRYHLDPVRTWTGLYDGELPDGCFATLFDRIGHNDLVIGFEIPPVMRRMLAGRGLDYISFHNHPLRFLKDLTFGAHTNAPKLRSSLEAIACEPLEIERQAARFSARFARLDPIQARLPVDCPLLFGQTNDDASLIFNGRLAHWRDFAQELNGELRNHSEIALVRHPHAQWQLETIEFFRSTLGKTVIAIAGNSYQLIMSGHPHSKVLTLSSSIGAEASFFGYKPRFLLSDPREKFAVSGCDNPVQIMVDHRLLEPSFWDKALSGNGEGISARSEPFYLGSNFTRGTLEGWAMAQLDSPDPYVDMDKWVFPAANVNKSQIDEVVATLSGTAPGAEKTAIAEASAARISLRILPPPLQPGETWRWGRGIAGSDLALVEGFHSIEDDGAWSDGRGGTIAFAVGGRAGETLRIEGELAFSFFAGILPNGPALILQVNGEPRSGLLHGEGEEAYHRLPFVAHVPAGQLCHLRIEASHAASPAEFDLDGDPRQLGFMLHSMEIGAQSFGGAGDLPALRLWGIGDQPIEVSGSGEI